MGATSSDKDDGRIDALIGRMAPDPVCDDCIAERLDIKAMTVQRRAHELAGRRGYERATAACPLCATTKVTTRLTRR